MRLTRLARRLDKWTMSAYRPDARGLALCRMFVALAYLIVLFPSYSWIARYPDVFWHPRAGPFYFLPGFPPTAALVAIEAAIAAGLMALLVGYRTVTASYVVGLGLLIGDGFVYSFGHIEHKILAPLVLLFMAHSGWGSVWSVDARRSPMRRKIAGWPMSLLALATALLMFSSAIPKLLGGWLDPRTHAVSTYMVLSRAPHGWATELPVRSSWLLEPADWLALTLELAFIATVLAPNAYRVVIAAAALFHLAILVSMGIDFTLQLLAYAVFLPWDGLGRRLSWRDNVPGAIARHPVLVVASSAALYMALVSSLGPPVRFALSWTPDPRYSTALFAQSIGALLGLAYLGHHFAALRSG